MGLEPGTEGISDAETIAGEGSTQDDGEPGELAEAPDDREDPARQGVAPDGREPLLLVRAADAKAPAVADPWPELPLGDDDKVVKNPYVVTGKKDPRHYGIFWSTLLYNSFGKWLESPYSNPRSGVAKRCRECRMVSPTVWKRGKAGQRGSRQRGNRPETRKHPLAPDHRRPKPLAKFPHDECMGQTVGGKDRGGCDPLQ